METIGKAIARSQIYSQASSQALAVINPQVKQRAISVLEKYGDFKNFCALFNTSKCNEYLISSKDEMYVGKAPTMLVLQTAYGNKMAITWLELYLVDVVKCKGLYDKTDVAQLESVCNEILINYNYLKVTELMIFFSMFKSCKFRNEKDEDLTRMYGEFQGSVILDCLHLFLKERAKEIDRIEKERKPKVDYTRAITYEEFLKMKDKLK